MRRLLLILLLSALTLPFASAQTGTGGGGGASSSGTSYPGVTSDGNNGLAVSGSIAAGATLSGQKLSLGSATILTAVDSCASGNYWIEPVAGSINSWSACNNGVLSTTGFGASYSGVTSNGSNGLTISGNPSATTDAVTVGYVATHPSGANYAAGITCFGDSITSASGPAGISGYCPIMSTDFGGTAVNPAVSGSYSVDINRNQVYAMTSPTLEGNPTYTFLVGANDAIRAGLGTTCAVMGGLCDPTGALGSGPETLFTTTVQASLAWLAIPNTFKVYGVAATTSGTWAADNTLQSGLAEQSTTNGSTATFTVTTYGAPVYLCYRIVDGNGGTASITLDGVSVGTINGYWSSLIHTQLNTNDAVALARYPTGAGTHTLVVSVTSATSSSNIVSLVWAGTAPNTQAVSGPRVYFGGVLREQNDLNSANTATYDALVQSAAGQLQGDGIRAAYVPVRNYVNSTTDMSNSLHPATSGHVHLKDAFEWMAQPGGIIAGVVTASLQAAPPPMATVLSGGTFTPTSANQQIYMNSGTVSLPGSGIAAGTTYYIVNYGGSAATVSGLNYGSISLAPKQGVIVGTSGGGGWWVLSTTSTATLANCAVNSTSPAACGNAATGAVVVPTTTTTYTVNTTQVTAASRIFLFPMSFASNLPSSPTCVAPAVTSAATITAVSAGISFTFALPSTSGQTCWSFMIED